MGPRETPVGVELTRMLLCRQPPYRLAPASRASSPGIEPGPQPSHSLHAHPAHPEDENLVAARRVVEPRPAVSRTAVRFGTLASQYPDLDSAASEHESRAEPRESATRNNPRCEKFGLEHRSHGRHGFSQPITRERELALRHFLRDLCQLAASV